VRYASGIKLRLSRFGFLGVRYALGIKRELIAFGLLGSAMSNDKPYGYVFGFWGIAIGFCGEVR
jgi:hypothetical protein